MSKLGAIVLAAGKGKRMKSKDLNKVVLPLGNKPIILHGLNLLKAIKINDIVVVVGFAKESVVEVLRDQVSYAVQDSPLGTAHAVDCGLDKLQADTEDVIVMNGDDSAFYSEELINKLINIHNKSGAQVTFLTMEIENPTDLGRIIRGKNGELVGIVEEKDATAEQKEIKEINPQCFIFKINFLRRYLRKVEKNKSTGEYYLTNLIEIAIKNQEKIETVKAGKIPWRGINTKEELIEAEKLFS